MAGWLRGWLASYFLPHEKAQTNSLKRTTIQSEVHDSEVPREKSLPAPAPASTAAAPCLPAPLVQLAEKQNKKKRTKNGEATTSRQTKRPDASERKKRRRQEGGNQSPLAFRYRTMKRNEKSAWMDEKQQRRSDSGTCAVILGIPSSSKIHFISAVNSVRRRLRCWLVGWLVGWLASWLASLANWLRAGLIARPARVNKTRLYSEGLLPVTAKLFPIERCPLGCSLRTASRGLIEMPYFFLMISQLSSHSD